MGISVENGGILTTVQDEGRFGYQAYGVSTSGAMDSHAFHIANLLVGNKMTEGALEMTFMGPTLTFTCDNIIAVTGGDLMPMLDGQPMPMYQAVLVRKGQKLQFGGARNGCRGYIAFAGGLEIPEVMGSKSTLLRNNLGGVKGRKLEKGDTIAFTAPKTELSNMENRKVPADIYPADEVVLRVVLGPQDDEFTERGIRSFFWNSGVITDEFDRMGCRIEREPIEHKGDGNINTDGISLGSIQVPANGKPIIMLADRQSTGGYAKIGTVISVDLPKIAQSRPGQKVRFIQVSLELAQSLYIRERNKMLELDEKLNGQEAL
ncbi:KipI antagonist [Blautia sp. An249]|uniref:5-oxoprolinase subunit C family protein n=1 Tax=Blautia sp. An249 TaxID=1965603 RepID=UPI000B39DE94|nr:biotin-dependent carboxyltransferase family protein [Blautia sp. An249]OUO76474.1 KipI antagonist [Blautia sp. An249]